MYTSVFPTCPVAIFFFFFNDTATTEIYTLSLHDALPISRADDWRDAHFGQFVAILDEYLQLREANPAFDPVRPVVRSEEHTSELQSHLNIVWRLLLLKKKKSNRTTHCMSWRLANINYARP